MKLPPFNKSQKRALRFAFARDSSAWFMPPGVGKTRSWLHFVNETPGNALVIAPKTVCLDTWPRENAKWGHDFDMRFLHGSRKTLDRLPPVTLINYEGLPWLAGALAAHMDAGRPFPFTTLIGDELSKMKSVDTQRWRAIAPWLERFEVANGGTGTPVPNHLIDVYGEISFVDCGAALGVNPKAKTKAQGFTDGFDAFKRRWFHEDKYTMKITPTWDAEDEIIDAISDTAISFDMNDLDMPGLAHVPVMLELPAAVRELYTEMHEHNIVETLDVYAMNAAVKSGKKRQMASGAVFDMKRELIHLHDVKAQKLREIVDEMQGSPVLVFFEYHHDYAKICATLGEVPAIYGGTRARDVPRIVARWNRGEIPVLALHPRSAGWGLNMQDSGHALVWYTLPWSYELIRQGIGRLWRQGQKNRVFNYALIVAETEDERVFEKAKMSEKTHDSVMRKLL